MALTTYISGEVLTAASLNANLSFAATNPPASPGGLTLISATTIGTTVASVAVSGAFSATFDAYRIIVSGGVASAGDLISLRLTGQSTQYFRSESSAAYTGAITGNTDQNTSSWRRVGICNANSLEMCVDLINPFLTKRTNLIYTRSDPNFAAPGGGIQDSSVSFTAFTIFAESAATFTGGTVAVYGYAK